MFIYGYDCMHINVFNAIFKKMSWENIVENGWNYDKISRINFIQQSNTLWNWFCLILNKAK